MTDFSTPPEAGFCDAHVHLQDGRFGDELPRYFERARRRGVRRFVCSGTSPADWNKTAKIARTYPDVWPTFGVHPWFVGKSRGDWQTALKIVLDSTVAADGRTGAAIGEIGLDFIVREKNFVEQEDAFRFQLELANERKLPIVVHSVRANPSVLKALAEYSKIPTILLHGWVATRDEIEKAVDLGAFFSFSPRSVRPNAVRSRETIAAVPRDRILLESDGPNPLPPNGYANPTSSIATIALQERDADGALCCEPAAVADVAAEIGAIRSVKADEFFRQLALNERRFFQYWPRRDATNRRE